MNKTKVILASDFEPFLTALKIPMGTAIKYARITLNIVRLMLYFNLETIVGNTSRRSAVDTPKSKDKRLPQYFANRVSEKKILALSPPSYS